MTETSGVASNNPGRVITVAVLLELSVLPHMRPLDGETRQQQQQAGQEGRQGLLWFMFD